VRWLRASCIGSEELAINARWRIPRSHPAPELPVLSNQELCSGAAPCHDPSVWTGPCYDFTFAVIFWVIWLA
jgi:hypothetical protein